MKRLFVMLLTVSVVLTTVSLNSKAASHAQKNMQQSKDQEETDLVYGNGGYLVKVGQKVFFHDYQKTDVMEPSLGGQFLEYGSGICSYDEATGEISTITDAPCSGLLYYCGDSFYSTWIDESGKSQIIRVSMDGEIQKVGPGIVSGVSEDSKLIALWCDDASMKHLDVLDESGVQYCRIDKRSDVSLSFCGLTDSDVIYQKTEDDVIKLYSMGSNNKEIYLGTLSELGIYGSLECDDFLYDTENQEAYFVFAHYGGPVDSVEDYIVVKAVPGDKDSLELITHGYDYEIMPGLTYDDEPKLRLNDGKLLCGYYDLDKLYLSHSYMGSHMLSRFVYGDLLWCNSKGQIQTMISNFIPYMDKDHLIMQTGEVLGDEAYVLVAEVIRDPGNDYKLLQAFDFVNMYVLRLPMKEWIDDAEVILGGDFEASITFDKEGFKPYIGIWRMDNFITEDGYEPDHSKDMWINITDTQELYFIDNAEYGGQGAYSNLFKLSTSTVDDKCLIVGYNEVLGITCTGSLYEEDGEVKLILEVQEIKESIDDPGPSSWKGSFHKVSSEEWSVEWG